MVSINKNVLFTIAYLNAMDFVPTTFEVWRHFIDIRGEKKKCDFFEVIRSLEQLEKQKIILSENGFWKLAGYVSANFCQNRILKQKISIAKIKKAKKWMILLSKIPFLRAVIFDGTLAMKNSNRESDWDVLIITKKNRIWLGRLLLSLVLGLMGKRRHGEKIKNKFCLNHYLSENGLILEESGVFVANESSFSFWMTGRDVARRFYQMNDFKNKNFLPNFSFDLIESDKLERIDKVSKLILFVEELLEKIGIAGLLNELTRKSMIWKINHNPKTKKPGADIRVSNQALIFLPEPKRNLILKRAEELIEKSVKFATEKGDVRQILEFSLEKFVNNVDDD